MFLDAIDQLLARNRLEIESTLEVIRPIFPAAPLRFKCLLISVQDKIGQVPVTRVTGPGRIEQSRVRIGPRGLQVIVCIGVAEQMERQSQLA